MTWDDYLYKLANLPIIFAGHYKWEPGTDHEKKVYENLLWQFQMKAQWLNYLNPGDKPFPKWLTHESNVLVKPIAQLSKAFLDLCVAIVEYANLLSVSENGNSIGENIEGCGMIENLDALKQLIPVDLWFTTETRGCIQYLWESGLIDGEGVPTRKRDFYDERQSYISLLENPSDFKRRNQEIIKGPEIYIPMLASAIAKDDIRFRYSVAYQNYIKRQRFNANLIRKNKSYSFIHLSDGNIIANRTQKGFG
jgi:hypothetical protein